MATLWCRCQKRNARFNRKNSLPQYSEDRRAGHMRRTKLEYIASNYSHPLKRGLDMIIRPLIIVNSPSSTVPSTKCEREVQSIIRR